MDAKGREKFWNVLKDIHDNAGENVKKLMDASPWPERLCKFRAVTGHSLQQLNENKMFFSSADHYDDPFDTYFYINVDQMVPTYEELRDRLLKGNKEFIDVLHQIAVIAGQEQDAFVRMLSTRSLNFTQLKGQLKEIRNSMQRRMFSICLCENPYNETLWLKYAENYSGFVQVYNLKDPTTFLCGTEENCQNCVMAVERPYIYPIYYSDTKYDATKFATGIWLMDKIAMQNNSALTPLYNYVYSNLMWEAERVSLIKKKCHEHDEEWRMIRPAMMEQRTPIRIKPSKVIIGMRTPEYESRLIVSASVNAGVKEIHRLYINDSDELDSAPVPIESYHI